MASKEATLLLRIKAIGEEVLDRIGSGLSSMKEIALASFAAISGVVVLAINEFQQAEAANNALTRSMINQGIYSKALKADYDAQAEALQGLTKFSDDQATSAQAVLQGHLGQTKISKELMMATADLATVMKTDLESAAQMIGKTIGTNTNALARQGIEVNTNATAQEKLAAVLEQLNGKWGGQAEAAASGLGILIQLKNIFLDLMETIGERIAPVITMFSGKLKALGEDTQLTKDLIDGFVVVLETLTQAGVVVGTIFETVAKIIGTQLAASMEIVSAIIKGDFKRAWELGKEAAKENIEDIGTTYERVTDRMIETQEAFHISKNESEAAQAELEQQNLANDLAKKQEIKNLAKITELEAQMTNDDLMLQQIGKSEEQKAQLESQMRIKRLDEQLKQETDNKKKIALMEQIHAEKMKLFQLKTDEDNIKNRADTYKTIATLQNSNNKALAIAGKAAAITQIAIETPVAIAKALSAFPPPINFVAAGLVGVAMAAQAASIAGVQLAEGGIVMPRPGGVQATIGEGGQAEAVIPLDRAGEFGLGGGGLTVHFHVGAFMGNEQDAYEFAKKFDSKLLELRRNNESVAFDDTVT